MRPTSLIENIALWYLAISFLGGALSLVLLLMVLVLRGVDGGGDDEDDEFKIGVVVERKPFVWVEGEESSRWASLLLELVGPLEVGGPS